MRVKRRMVAAVLTMLLLMVSSAASAHSADGASHNSYTQEKLGYTYYQQGALACYQVTVNDKYYVTDHYTNGEYVETTREWEGTVTYNHFFSWGTCPAN